MIIDKLCKEPTIDGAENIVFAVIVVLLSLIIIFSLAMMSGLISCKEPNVEKTRTTYQIDNEMHPLEIVVIDSCEYLYGPWGNATVLTHKGNCKNPIHIFSILVHFIYQNKVFFNYLLNTFKCDAYNFL